VRHEGHAGQNSLLPPFHMQWLIIRRSRRGLYRKQQDGSEQVANPSTYAEYT
jgi:hypothetical protein